MKVVTSIITILAVAGQSLNAGLQPSHLTVNEELQMKNQLERFQDQLEIRHMNAVKAKVQIEIEQFSHSLEQQFDSHIHVVIAEGASESIADPLSTADQTAEEQTNDFWG